MKPHTFTLRHLELLTVEIPHKRSFQSAVGQRHSRKALLLRWTDQDGETGIGECSCRPDTYYSHEFLNGVELLITEQIFPQLKPTMTHDDLAGILGRIRGWPFARSTVWDAVYDLQRRKGYQDPIEHWNVPQQSRIPVGISLGLYNNTEVLLQAVSEAHQEGYRRIKLKIKPGLPAHYLAEVHAAFPDQCLSWDANGSFSEENMDELVALAALNPHSIEQPFAPDRLDLSAELKRRAPTARVCLDEGVAAIGHLLTALQLKALDELNIKPGRVGGIDTAIALAQRCKQEGIQAWVGGMFECGIGRVANLRFASCLPEAVAHDLSPSQRYFAEDLIADPPTMDSDGTIPLPKEPVQVITPQIDKFLLKQKSLSCC